MKDWVKIKKKSLQERERAQAERFAKLATWSSLHWGRGVLPSHGIAPTEKRPPLFFPAAVCCGRKAVAEGTQRARQKTRGEPDCWLLMCGCFVLEEGEMGPIGGPVDTGVRIRGGSTSPPWVATMIG